jgi:ornithine carbamoyltransferase
MTASTSLQHFIGLTDLSPQDVHTLFHTADRLKSDRAAHAGDLAGRAVVLLFEKESLRTKVSFEIGVARLGGTAIYHDHRDARIGERESVPDYARNLSRMADCLVARTYGHDVIEQLAEHATIPIVNALSDKEHPCQALADLFTLRERLGDPAGSRVAYVGDGNNVCHSLMLGCALLGVHATAITPERYAPAEDVVHRCRTIARSTGAEITLTPELDAVEGATAVYTDAWVSMGHEAEAAQRHVALAGYQVTRELMSRAGPDALFMHCLPAHRGFEVEPEVIDSPRSIVFDQAENRMHLQNAILSHLLTAS